MTNPIKIVATIGPVSCNAEMLLELHAAGMSVARLNGSHATLEWHSDAIRLIRATVPSVPILLDTPGRKIRTAKQGTHREIKRGDSVVLTSSLDAMDSEKVVVATEGLHRRISLGDTVQMDDGNLRLTVGEIDDQDVVCIAQNDWVLLDAKGVHFPGLRLNTDSVTIQDRVLIDFAIEQGVDFVGASFVEMAEDVAAIREIVGPTGPSIIAKIETESAVAHVGDIAAAADALMIDRGDLSVETNIHEVAIFQKQVLSAAAVAATPVIVATEILHSMINNPIPTKAEVSDITNAVLDRASALMLSAETAIGRYPVESVQLMTRVATASVARMQTNLDDAGSPAVDIPEAMGDAIALICRRLGITKIVAVTQGGFAARMAAIQMPKQSIIGVTNSEETARRLNLYPGTEGVHVDVTFSRTSMDHVPSCLHSLWTMGMINDDDLILVTALGYPKSGNRMNLIETHLVADLRDALGW
jgi:pyruvate kinase